MTTTPAAPAPQAGSTRTLHLSELLRRPIADRGGESLGRLSDVIVQLRGAEYPVVTGLVAAVGGREVYVPIGQVGSFDGEVLKLIGDKNASGALALLPVTFSVIDRSAKLGVIKKNTAARYKSRLSARVRVVGAK
jgi:sporulation protein YlmC with PRC-barrel domain